MKIQSIGGKRPVQMYWINRFEAEDDGISEVLKTDFAFLRERKIMPVVIESGEGDTEEMVYLLLKRNIDHPHTELSKAS